MPKQNKQAGMNQAQNATTEFASETNVSEVRRQNQQSAAKSGAQAGQTATEFASETNAAEVRRQNQQSAANSSSQQTGQATE
ncbi:gamma-type small acid-soluble spore protein [Brevibacillus choshinensis]|uniref:gamma-type small acid-soluble spore protein n=1 Tax=Brevibacillus choshinensis TaxID=54911 RepID=UPI002E1A2449|nr:gamma-type small acid-soluble spore protein [Brevibacillus choshinensis]MED4586331.1 gamma-type small acid-soluble spore protein [Brevibacillus choshinensis]